MIFTFLEDGFYLPSIGVVLPEGTYRGRITRDAPPSRST